jgi:hypothetical protein
MRQAVKYRTARKGIGKQLTRRKNGKEASDDDDNASAINADNDLESPLTSALASQSAGCVRVTKCKYLTSS